MWGRKAGQAGKVLGAPEELYRSFPPSSSIIVFITIIIINVVVVVTVTIFYQDFK